MVLNTTFLRTYTGSSGYVAPEVASDAKRRDQQLTYQYTPSVDIQSTGCILFKLLAGEIPFPEGDEPNDDSEVDKVFVEKIQPGWATEAFMEILRQLLQVVPDQRITALEALGTPWLARAGKPRIVSLAWAQLTLLTCSQDREIVTELAKSPAFLERGIPGACPEK